MIIETFNIYATEKTENEQIRLIVEKCPFCDMSHNHYKQNQKPYYGQYLAHCLIGEYRLWSK